MAKKKNTNAPQVKAGVGVIVKKGHKVLVGRRKGSHGAGVYAFPGGHLDHTDTSLAHCGEREVYEETGMLCKVISPDQYREDLFTTFDILSEDGQKIYVTSYLLADHLQGEPVLKEPQKCEGWAWVSLEELASLVQSEDQRAWIPVQQVIFYLNQIWGIE